MKIEKSKSEIGMLHCTMESKFPHFCGYGIDVLLKLQTINYIKIRSVGTVLPQSREEKDKDNHLHDMVQKYCNGEISREQYTRTLLFKYQARTELWDYHLILLYIFALSI